MISLESSRWQSLSHAYGDATDVPKMLSALQHTSAREPKAAWDEIWSSLCHQGTVYTATYAAVPHLVELASRATASDPTRADCLVFVGAVAMSTDAAPIPDDLRADYASALTRAEPLVLAALEAQPTRAETVVYLLQTLSALHGCTRTADLLEGFVDGEFIICCPAEACGAEIYVSIADGTMYATTEDPATEGVGVRTEISPRPRVPGVEAGPWSDDAVLPLLTDLASRAGHSDLAATLALWDGTILCLKCREPFVLRSALLNPTEL